MKTLATLLGSALITFSLAGMSKSQDNIIPEQDFSVISVQEDGQHAISWREKLEHIVESHPYSATTAQNYVVKVGGQDNGFGRFRGGWRDNFGRVYIDGLDEKLKKARAESENGPLNLEQLSRVEQSVTRQLGLVITSNFNYRRDIFDLQKVIDSGTANCFGYAQSLCYIGRSLGLNISFMSLSDNHVANVLRCSDGSLQVVDLISPRGFISEPVDFGPGEWNWQDDNHLTKGEKTMHILTENEADSELHFCRGTKFYMGGMAEEAIVHFDWSLSANPQNSKAYNNRGGSKLILSKHEDAIMDFDRAIELNPRYVSAHHNRANAFLDLEKYDNAIEGYSKVIELNPGFAKAYFGRAFANRALGNTLQAIKDATEAIKLNPTFASAYQLRGVCYATLSLDGLEASDSKMAEQNEYLAQRDWSMSLSLDMTLKDFINTAREEFGVDKAKYAKAVVSSYKEQRLVSTRQEEKVQEPVKVAADTDTISGSQKFGKSDILGYYRFLDRDGVYALYPDNTLRLIERETRPKIEAGSGRVNRVLSDLISVSYAKDSINKNSGYTNNSQSHSYRKISENNKHPKTVGGLVSSLTK